MWVQIRRVPNNWSSRKVGWKLSKLSNVIIPENGSKNGRMLKLLVEVELDKPLLRGTKIELENEFV